MHEEIESFRMPPHDVAERAATVLSLLAEPTRLRILWALAQGETNVGCLAQLAGTTPTAVSQHLARLRLAGLVTARREGTFAYYTVADPSLARLLADAVEHAGRSEPGLADALAAVAGSVEEA